MLLHVLITLIIVGFLLWLVNSFIPMDGRVKQIVNVLAIVLVVIYVVSALFGHPLLS